MPLFTVFHTPPDATPSKGPGVIFGFVAYSKGDRRGLWVGIGSIVTTIAGIVIGVAVLHAVHHSRRYR